MTVSVRPVNDAPVAVLGAPAAIDEGSSGTLTLSATDIDGDALTYTWATDGGTLVPSAGGTSATLAGGDGPAARHVTVKVSDGTTWVTVATDVAVDNLAPSVAIVQPAPGAHTTVGTAIALSATTSDAGGDAVTCSISWGDATTSASGCAADHTYSQTGTFTATVTADDGDGGVATASVTVVVDAAPDTAWHFDGFFQPVDNLPVVNTVRAGSTVPLKFSLGGYHGTAIFAPGYPASAAHPCGSSSAEDAIEQLSTPGESTLTYDAGSDRYHYNWKTEKGWAGQCRTLASSSPTARSPAPSSSSSDLLEARGEQRDDPVTPRRRRHEPSWHACRRIAHDLNRGVGGRPDVDAGARATGWSIKTFNRMPEDERGRVHGVMAGRVADARLAGMCCNLTESDRRYWA